MSQALQNLFCGFPALNLTRVPFGRLEHYWGLSELPAAVSFSKLCANLVFFACETLIYFKLIKSEFVSGEEL